MAQKNRTIRGIRDKIPPGYILGRTSSGNGAVELIPIAGNLQGLNAIGGGGGGGSGGISTTLTSAHILVGNASNVATDVAMSGDVAIDDTGATTVSKASDTGFNVLHYARIGSLSAPTNTTDGDLTAVRGFFGTQGITLKTGKIFDAGYSPTTWAAGQSVAMAVGSTGAADAGGTTDARLLVFSNTITGSNGASVLSGAQGDGIWNSSGTLSTGIGFSGSAQSIGGGTITGAYGVGGVIVSANAGSVVTEGRALYARSPIASTGSITQAVGLRIDTQKVGANVGTGYGIKQVSTSDLNYLAGNTRIGSTSNPTHTLDVTGNETVSGYLGIGSNSSPANTTAGDLTATRAFVSGAATIGGTSVPTTSSVLDLAGTTGALLVPRLTTTQRSALTPSNGMVVYDTTLNAFYKYENGGWSNFAGGSSGGSAPACWWCTVAATTFSSGAFATKGVYLTPQQNFSVISAIANLNAVTSQTYKAVIATVNPSTNTILSIVATSSVVTIASTAAQNVTFSFSSSVALNAGNTYAIMIVRTDSTTTAVNPIRNNSTSTIVAAFVGAPILQFFETTTSCSTAFGYASTGPAVSDVIGTVINGTFGIGLVPG